MERRRLIETPELRGEVRTFSSLEATCLKAPPRLPQKAKPKA
jgi:hypothetical protein